MRPAVTIILTSHMKPTLGDALASVVAQTRTDFECVVMDSGQWFGVFDERSRIMGALHDEWAPHPLIRWESTGEEPGLASRACPVSWATNETIRRGLVTGDYVCTFYDDDTYEPRFIEAMAGYLDDHPDTMAVWCSQYRKALLGTGELQDRGTIPADRIVTPGSADCRVDGGQVMFRREVLDIMGDPWFSEEPRSCSHSDGIFLEWLADVSGGIHPLDEYLLTHRFTSFSTYTRP